MSSFFVTQEVAMLCPGRTPARSDPVNSRQFFQQRFAILEVSSVKALGEPTVDRRQELLRFCPLTLLLPQPTQARCGAQLQRFRLLAAGYGEGLVQTSLSLRVVVGRQR